MFRRQLNTKFFLRRDVLSALEIFRMHYISWHVTYLLTSCKRFNPAVWQGSPFPKVLFGIGRWS